MSLAVIGRPNRLFLFMSMSSNGCNGPIGGKPTSFYTFCLFNVELTCISHYSIGFGIGIGFLFPSKLSLNGA